MENEKKTRVVDPEARVMVKVQDVCKKFGPISALDHISFEIRQGEVIGFLGPNGAGKTTAMRILTAFFPPSEGRVWIDGKDLFQHPQELKRRIGYLPESVGLYTDMRVREFLSFVAKMKGVPAKNQKEHIDEKLERCGLGGLAHRIIGRLSKGMKQRVALAQALISDPDVLILDEPTSGLDPKQIIDIRLLIKELGRERTLILSTHILPEVSMVCDRVLIINQGRLVASGTTDQLGAGLQAGQEIVVTIGERHRRDEIINLLKNVQGVERVTLTEEIGDRIILSLGIAKGLELGPEISRLFVQYHIPLLEMRTHRLSLEDIFIKLVLNETAATGPAI